MWFHGTDSIPPAEPWVPYHVCRPVWGGQAAGVSVGCFLTSTRVKSRGPGGIESPSDCPLAGPSDTSYLFWVTGSQGMFARLPADLLSSASESHVCSPTVPRPVSHVWLLACSFPLQPLSAVSSAHCVFSWASGTLLTSGFLQNKEGKMNCSRIS